MKGLFKKIGLPALRIRIAFAPTLRVRKEAEELKNELEAMRDRVIAFAGQLDAWRLESAADSVRREILQGPVDAPDYYRLKEELDAMRRRYAIFEEMAPPDVPRSIFAEMCFDTFGKSLRLEEEVSRLKQENNDLLLHYTGMAGLLCEASVDVTEETRECIDAALTDWCKRSPGWTVKRTLNRYSLVPPKQE